MFSFLFSICPAQLHSSSSNYPFQATPPPRRGILACDGAGFPGWRAALRGWACVYHCSCMLRERERVHRARARSRSRHHARPQANVWTPSAARLAPTANTTRAHVTAVPAHARHRWVAFFSREQVFARVQHRSRRVRMWWCACGGEPCACDTCTDLAVAAAVRGQRASRAGRGHSLRPRA